MPTDPCKAETKKVLLVEGKDDCHVVMSLCNAFAVPEVFGLFECGGFDQLLKRLNALILQPDAPEVIGVMLDADVDLAARWRSLSVKLNHYDYVFPNTPETNGTIIQGEGVLPKLGIWLMPNNTIAGMLEDFCLEMVDPRGRTTAEDTIRTAEAAGVTSFIPSHRSKAIVHTFLAWQDEPGNPLGLAITTQALRPNTNTARTFIEWLQLLFL
jgi:hypothetical protein